MTDFHKYRATVTGYSPSPNRWFVRHTAPVGKVPTTNWNLQKATVTGYTQPSNQYFATRQRMAYHPADRTFGSFSGTQMTVEGIAAKKQEAPKEAPKPAPKATGTLPKGFETQQTQTQHNCTRPSERQTNKQPKSETLEQAHSRRQEFTRRRTSRGGDRGGAKLGTSPRMGV